MHLSLCEGNHLVVISDSCIFEPNFSSSLELSHENIDW